MYEPDGFMRSYAPNYQANISQIIYCDFSRFTYNAATELYHDDLNGIRLNKDKWERYVTDEIPRAVMAENGNPRPISVSALTIIPKALRDLRDFGNTGRVTTWNSGSDDDDAEEADYEAMMIRKSRSSSPWISGLGWLLDGTILHEVCCCLSRLKVFWKLIFRDQALTRICVWVVKRH